MFVERPDVPHLSMGAERLVALIVSVNSPLVAVQNRPLEKTRVWIVGAQNPNRTYSVYIYLHLTESNLAQMFLHDPPEIAREQYHETELEALQFVETMGFIMENANFRNLTPDQQQALMAEVPAFYEDLADYARANAAPGEADESTDDEAEIMELDEVMELEGLEAPVISGEDLARIARLFAAF